MEHIVAINQRTPQWAGEGGFAGWTDMLFKSMCVGRGGVRSMHATSWVHNTNWAR